MAESRHFVDWPKGFLILLSVCFLFIGQRRLSFCLEKVYCLFGQKRLLILAECRHFVFLATGGYRVLPSVCFLFIGKKSYSLRPREGLLSFWPKEVIDFGRV